MPGQKVQSSDSEGLDFAIAAWREEGQWALTPLPPRAVAGLEVLVRSLQAQNGDGGTLGFLSVADDFFLIVRVQGATVRWLLSDVTAAGEWPLADDVLDALGIPESETEDVEGVQPAGDLTILADMGLDAAELDMLCANLDLYPDEALGSVATRLGFGDEYDRLLESIAG